MLGFQLHVFLMQLLLPNGGKQNADRNCHDTRYNNKQRQIVDMLETRNTAGGIQDAGNKQVQNAAHGAHQIDDGIGAAAQRLGGDIGHEGDRRRAVGAHGDQQQTQHGNEQHQFGDRGIGGVAVIQNGQQHHQQDGAAGTDQNKGHTASHTAAALIADGAEQRQQEQGKDIIRRHDDAGIGFIKVEGVGEDLGDHTVVHLPKGADGKERKPDQYGAFVVELQVHSQYLLLHLWGYCTYHSAKRGDLQGGER